jgi:CDP-ribitol ribitolphosphotransferase
MRQRLIRARIAAIRLGFRLGRLMPLRTHVVLASSQDRQLTGNLARIGREIGARLPGTRVVTLGQRPEPGRRGKLRGLVHGFVAGYHLATARLFVVDSHFTPIYVVTPRAGTTIVQTWHACGAIKKIGYSVLDKAFGADELTVSMVPIHANYTLCLAASDAAAWQFVDAFRQPRELFVTDLGIPRTDLLFGDQRSDETSAAIRRRYGLDDGRRVILYAPTFRGESMLKARFHDGLDVARLRDVLGEDHVLLVRLHPAVRDELAIDPGLADFVVDVSDWPEMNELLPVVDVLVTDYSSVIFEFALLGRPMAFFAPDIDDYDAERGFYFDYRTGVPAPVFETTEPLAAYLRAGDFDLGAVRAFAGLWFEVADGHASERFVERVVRPALAGEPLSRGI